VTDDASTTIPPDGPTTGWLAAFPPRRRHLILAAACVVGVYLAGVTGRWWPTPDSSLYLGLGWSLAEGGGYRFNGEVCNIVTPGLPWILAGLRLGFGRVFWAPNLFVAGCGVAAIGLTYLTVARLAERRTALAVALATAFSYPFYVNSHKILTDAPAVALTWATLYAAVRFHRGGVGWLVLAGILSAASITLRAPGLLVYAPLALGLLLDRDTSPRLGRRLASAATVGGVGLATGFVFYRWAQAIASEAPPYVAGTMRSLSAGIVRRLQGFADGLCQVPFYFTEILTSQKEALLPIGIVGMVLCVVGFVSLWRRGKRLAPTASVLYLLILGFVSSTIGVGPRYLMPVQALFVWGTFEGLFVTVRWTYRRRRRPLRPTTYLTAATALAAMVIVVSGVRLGRNAFYYSYLARTDRYYKVIRHGWFDELFAVADVLGSGRLPNTAALTPPNKASILHFVSGRLTRPQAPTECETADEADRVYDHVAAAGEIRIVVVDVADGDEPFRRRLKQRFAASADFKHVFWGGRYRVYVRPAPTTRAAPSSARAGG